MQVISLLEFISIAVVFILLYAFIKTLLRYKAEKSSKFLSHHVNVVDNNQVSTVKSENKEDDHKLAEILQRGYSMSGRTIRPALVKVWEV